MYNMYNNTIGIAQRNAFRCAKMYSDVLVQRMQNADTESCRSRTAYYIWARNKAVKDSTEIIYMAYYYQIVLKLETTRTSWTLMTLLILFI